MAGITNNLYPPIISSYMPAFIRTQACKVYFSLSAYNEASEIKNVQVIVSNQNSSLSALDATKYPSGIKIATLNVNTEINSNEKYYITINPSDLKDGIFEIGQYYKVQLRFTSTTASTLTDTKKIASWLSENQQYFSEWSTVCLVKGIEKPQIYLKGFEDIDSSSNEVVFTTEVLDLVGNMYYENNSTLEDEYLKYYNVDIYDISNETETLYYSSGIVYTNEFYPNEINYTLKCNLEDGINYLLRLTYTTSNEYSSSVEYSFSCLNTGVGVLNATISAEADEENGRVAVSVVSTNSTVYLGNLCIRRSSSETNFTVWEDIKIVVLQDGEILNYTWYDYTVQGGIYYSYCAQKIDTKGNRGIIITTRYPIMLYLDDIFLTREDFQLKVRYNPSISSFKVNYLESKTDTIGSKYPYIRRNGNVAYKTFPISGLITAFCDEDNIFTSKEDFYGEVADYYADYNEEEQITEYKDFMYEKFFRDKVMNFLYGNNVKLFRSLTEGNILVKLMDISFTPQQSLGRMLYSFSATAYEVDECSIDNYEKYNILTVGEYSDYIQYSYNVIGQLNDTISANTNILPLLQTKYEETNLAEGEYYNVVNYLNWIRIEFQSEPYLIYCGTDGSLTPWNSGTKNENVVYGYIVYINNQATLVSARGYYELNDEDTVVTSIWFPVSSEVIIDYSAAIDEIEDNSTIANRYYYYVKVGQLWGTFAANDSIFEQIYLKYYEKYSTYYLNLLSINRIRVESDPGTVVYIKDSFDEDWFRHEVGSTGSLDFYDEDTTIVGFYFYGRHLNEMEDYSRLEPADNEFRETGIVVDSFDEISNPVKNGVYTVASAFYQSEVPEDDILLVNEDDTIYHQTENEYTLLLQQLINDSANRYIYYQGQWYNFTSDNDVICTVTGLVDYIVEVVKGEY